MKTGFIINSDLCVDCKACKAACLIENRWSVSGRNIYTSNPDVISTLPITHLSLACNHCEQPLCLEGCPTGAYSLDDSTSAIIIESEKCIGCRYCLWNCPYDAPKTNINQGFIEKCDFCYSRLQEGIMPACTAACPTGSLRYGEIPEIADNIFLNWVPDKKINPRVLVSDSKNQTPLKVFPEIEIEKRRNEHINITKDISGEWSLILFSFLTILSVSYNFTDLLGRKSTYASSVIVMLILAGIFSIFHLRIKNKAWRAVLNFKNSPLSREIILFSIFFLLIFANYKIDNNILLIISVLIGLLLLIAIDGVYTYSDRSSLMKVHSGQAFLTGLLISSYLSNIVASFIFIASLKMLFDLYYLLENRRSVLHFNLRMIRISILLIISVSMISGKGGHDIFPSIIFLSGEFFDRILYYVDFNPININDEIAKYLIFSKNEKKRDQ